MKRETLGALLILCLALLVVFGPIVSSHNGNDIAWDQQNHPPSLKHWLGTDNMGRDLLVRTLEGGRVSLLVALVATLLSVMLGVVWGASAAMLGGWSDRLMMRLVDVLYGIPFMFLVILLVTIMGRGLFNLFIAIALLQWLNVARIVRGEVLAAKQQEYMMATKAMGVGFWRGIFRHLLINMASPVLVCTTLTVPTVMMEEAFISFLGLGVQPPHASWGSLIHEGVKTLDLYPWQIAGPGTAFFLAMLAFHLLGEGWRERFDVKRPRRPQVASRFWLG